MSERSIDHDLERRVRAIELAMLGQAPAGLPRRRSRTRRILVAIATVIVLATLPMMTVASDVFVDVDDTHRFHDEITELYSAGITKGCATVPRRFCPDEAVSRGQMAALLTRGLGRASESVAVVEVEGDGGVVDSITVDAGAGGYALVTVTLTAATLAEGGACPCKIGFPLSYDGLRTIPRPHVSLAGPGSHGSIYASGSLTELIPVLPGSSTIDLVAFVERSGSGPVTLSIHMTALYVPFGSGE